MDIIKEKVVKCLIDEFNREMEAHFLFPGEQEAIDMVLSLGKQYGYGNLIYRLRDRWSEELQEKFGFDEEIAYKATNVGKK